MKVFDFIKPGSVIEGQSGDAKILLLALEGEFFEANDTFNLFTEYLNVNYYDVDMAQREADHNRREAIKKTLRHRYPEWPSWEEEARMDLRADLVAFREEWSSGRVPRTFSHGRLFMYAKAFLNALSMFGKMLSALSKEPGAPPKLLEICKRFEDEFPELGQVRNSLQHMDDRIRRIGPNKKPMTIVGGLVMSELVGTTFGCTMATGEYGEVDISIEKMTILHEIMDDVFKAFSWSGKPSYIPR